MSDDNRENNSIKPPNHSHLSGIAALCKAISPTPNKRTTVKCSIDNDVQSSQLNLIEIKSNNGLIADVVTVIDDSSDDAVVHVEDGTKVTDMLTEDIESHHVETHSPKNTQKDVVISNSTVQPNEGSSATNDRDKPSEAISDDDIKITHEVESSENCAICLGNFTNRSFLNECFHAFCYYCILQWSEISQTCPLCKSAFRFIVHDVKSITEYKETQVQKTEPAIIPFEIRNVFRQTVRYRTTRNSVRTINSVEGTGDVVNITQRKRRRKHGPLSESNRLKEGRIRVYTNNLYAKSPKITGKQKIRKATPDFFAELPGTKHRLIPWLTNELEVLLYENNNHVLFVLEIIWRLLDEYSIKSEKFKDEIRPFLFEKTELFCHELYMFAISPLDLKTYLSKVQYDDSETTETQNSGSRWDQSPVRYIGETSGAQNPDTISRTRWEKSPSPIQLIDEKDAVSSAIGGPAVCTRTERNMSTSTTSSVEFIKEKEKDIDVVSDSPGLTDDDVSPTPRLIMMSPSKNTSSDNPILIEDTPPAPDIGQKTPDKTISESENGTHHHERRPSGDSAISDGPESFPLTEQTPKPSVVSIPLSSSQTCSVISSPVMCVSPARNTSPAGECSPSNIARSHTPSPEEDPPKRKGKGKEKRKKVVIEQVPSDSDSPSITDKLRSVIRVLENDNEPCSSKDLT